MGRYPASVAGVALEKVPLAARTAWLALRDELNRILRDDLVAIWAYGGTIAVEDPAHVADLDTYVILSRRPDERDTSERSRTRRTQSRRATASSGTRGTCSPTPRAAPIRRDMPGARNAATRHGRSIVRTGWPGATRILYGAEPADVVPAPTWAELEVDLDRELEHIERHVLEGDTDPYEATYAILNGSRIIRAVETGDVAISKRAAGQWALEHLPAPLAPGPGGRGPCLRRQRNVR